VGDPIASGLVTSLSHPGGNVTGTSGMFSESAGKRLELLNEMVPGLRRVAVLWNPSNRVFQTQIIRETDAAARSLGIELQMFEARDASSMERAFAAISKARPAGINVLPDPVFSAYSSRIAAFAASAGLPSVSASAGYAEAGGLMAYGPSFPEMARSAAGFVAKILKGDKPGTLAVERPTKFELVINRKAAKQIALTIPPSLQLRADRVIE
jgi:putative ABC transport system substrate-binding protein